MSTTTVSHYLTSAQAAAHIGYSEGTLCNWRSAGVGPAFLKVGQRVRYAVADLDAFMCANRVTPLYTRPLTGQPPV